MYNDFTTPTLTVTDAPAINNSIRNILMTPKGSLPGKPRFGSEIHKAVFSQIDTVTEVQIKTYIMQALTEQEPRIRVDNVELKSVPAYNRIIASISYSFKDQGVLLSSTFNLSIDQ